MKLEAMWNILAKARPIREFRTPAHTKLLFTITLVLGPIYLARAFYASTLPNTPTEVSTLLGVFSALLLGICYLSREEKHVSTMGFGLSLIILCIEARMSYLGFTDIFDYLFFTPICLLFSTLIYSFFAGLITFLLGVLLSVYLLRHDVALQQMAQLQFSFSDFLDRFFIYLVLTQIMCGMIIYFYQKSLDRSVEELRKRRHMRAKATRRAALSETMGKAAHEINNPLAILDGSLRMLKNLEANPESKDPSKYLSFMKNAHGRLQNVVSTVRTFASGELHDSYECIRVQDLMESLSAQLQETVHSYGVKFVIQNSIPDYFIGCRPQQILIALKVLAENAMEASEGPKPEISLKIFEEGDYVRFEVENKAEHLPVDVLDRLFTPFFTTKPVGKSLGMNLSICRVLVEEHGGSIGVHRANNTTVFWFTLPHSLAEPKPSSGKPVSSFHTHVRD